MEATVPYKNGFWQTKLIWKPRWIKSWQEKKIYVAHWKKVWGPIQVKEWVPLPIPPPGWTKPHEKHVHLHHLHKVPVPITPIRALPDHVGSVHRGEASYHQKLYPHYDGTLSSGILHDHHNHHHEHHSSPVYHHNPHTETFSPHFLPINLDEIKIK